MFLYFDISNRFEVVSEISTTLKGTHSYISPELLWMKEDLPQEESQEESSAKTKRHTHPLL